MAQFHTDTPDENNRCFTPVGHPVDGFSAPKVFTVQFDFDEYLKKKKKERVSTLYQSLGTHDEPSVESYSFILLTVFDGRQENNMNISTYCTDLFRIVGQKSTLSVFLID